MASASGAASGGDNGKDKARKAKRKRARKRREQRQRRAERNGQVQAPVQAQIAAAEANAAASAAPAAKHNVKRESEREKERLPVITAKAFAIANTYAAEFNKDARALCDCPAGCGCDCVLACVYTAACDCVCVGEPPDLMRLGDYMTMAQAQIALDEGIELDDVLDAPVNKYGDRIDQIIARLDYRALLRRDMEETADGVILNGVTLKTPTGRDAALIHSNGDFAAIRVIARCSGREVSEIEKMPVDEYMALWNWVGKVSRVSIETPW